MQFTLDDCRTVVVLAFVKQVYFRYRTMKNTHRGVMLDWRQLQNLNDIVSDLRSLHALKSYPIGGKMWLTYEDNNVIQLADDKSYFCFSHHAWKEYIRTTHWNLFQYFRDEVVACDQLYANDESQHEARPRRPLSHLRRKQYVISRSTGNACYATHQRKKYPTISKWHSATSRRHPHPRRRKDARRVLKEIKIEKEDETMSGNEADFDEHGSECTVEDPCCSPQLDLE